MKITVKNGSVITESRKNIARDYDWVDYSFDGDYEYASASGDDYEYAVGKKKNSNKSMPSDKPAKDKKVRKTFKERVAGFKTKVGNAVKWIGQHKTRKDARKLLKSKDKNGKDVHKDLVPDVKSGKDKDGNDVYYRTNPDGTTTEFKSGEVAKAANGKVYAESDLKKEGKNTVENGELVKIIPPDQVKELKTETGESIPFHKDDVIDKDAPDDGGKGMNPTTKKILIGSAIAVGVGILIFAVYKLSKRGKK